MEEDRKSEYGRRLHEKRRRRDCSPYGGAKEIRRSHTQQQYRYLSRAGRYWKNLARNRGRVPYAPEKRDRKDRSY